MAGTTAFYFKTKDGRLTAILAETETEARELVTGEIDMLVATREGAKPAAYRYADYEAFCKALHIKPN